MIEGYKGFSKGLVNAYGMKFEEHRDYKVDTRDKELKYGIYGYGFHFAERLEDCLRYYNGFEEEIDIAKVVALGNVLESYDDYYGYYDLYVTDHIYIEHVLCLLMPFFACRCICCKCAFSQIKGDYIYQQIP